MPSDELFGISGVSMTNRFFLSLLFLVCAAAVLSCRLCSAGVFDKETQAEDLYGQGVHAFFGGEYDAATDLFRQSKELVSQDPRVYFFLALSYRRLQKDDLAEPLFEKAAQLELNVQRYRDYNVSDALRRIQGNERIFVEKFREQAKKNWQSQEVKRRSGLYGKEQKKDDAVLKAIADSFVGAAPFGARSLHPFRTENDTKENTVVPADDLVPQASVKSDTSKPVFTKPAEIKPVQEEKKESAQEEKAEPAKEDMKSAAEEPKTDEEKKEEKTEEQKEEKQDGKKEEKKDKDEDPFA
jgi:hypothetical protein